MEGILVLKNGKQSSTFFKRKFNLMLQRITKCPASESCMQLPKLPFYFRSFRKSLLVSENNSTACIILVGMETS
ncbi:hypothetical protein PVAP13_5NG056908 [Panicum virgatum]|uniref:Uncharacterized protein n=1 Tax=Panicum virgatum TaxID=38727 RepID=A0A8T0RJZ0_PANVG|nr:hypothetical protein PVAP13_5NG056908 [Panicum virgatum]